MSLYERSEAEVRDLHRSIFEWCGGQALDGTSAWERIKQSWAPGFRLVNAEGLVEGSKHLLSLQVRFNESVPDPLRAVWIEGFTGYEVAPELFQAFYEEWAVATSGAERGRAWSVLLRSAGEGPQGLEWVHAHCSPLAEGAKPSFRPLEATAPALIEAEPEDPADLEESEDSGEALGPDEEPADSPWARREPAESAEPLEVAPWEPPPQLPPLTELRAFFGDAEAQALTGEAPPPVFDQHDPERWLRELRKGGPEALLRAGIVVLGHLLGPWEEWFPSEEAPRGIHAALTRYLAGSAQGLSEAQALVEAARESSATVQEFSPDEPLPEGYRAYVHATNAADAAARLAEAAGGSAVGYAVKLSPVLSALSEPVRLGLRGEILAALSSL